MSQELCRPLVSLKAGFDLILGDASHAISEEQRGHVASMVRLCDDLLALARGYLDFAGLVRGAHPLCHGTFAVGALVREIDRQFHKPAAARRIDWECTVDGPDGYVTTDASRCQQIFGQVVENALKFTPEGGRVRVVGAYRDDRWSLVVADSGPGIPEEELERVFEPFYRLSRDEHSKTEGTGLGLAVCRELVEQLGGRIRLTSISGQGTRASIEFPAEPPRPAAANAPAD